MGSKFWQWLARGRLRPADLQVGAHVTVASCSDPEDRSFHGDVLCVMAIDLPYVVVEWENRGVGMCHSRLDTRRYRLMYITPEYADATVKGVSDG